MTSGYIRIAFITDLHIDLPGVLLQERDTRQQFIQILNHVKNRDFDAIILGGDLCNKTGDTSIYQWVKEQLALHNIEAYPISGNHDTSILLAPEFGLQNHLKNDALYYKIQMDWLKCILLDTSSGSMDRDQWDWLQSEIESSGKNVYIFMHHPPVICLSKHMEPKYMFKQMKRFQVLCSAYPDKNFNIVTGHYHIEKTVLNSNMRVFVSPSTYLQIDPNSAEFKPFSPYFGYRILSISDFGEVNTEVVYL